MPELPEVETVRREILPFVKGKKILRIEYKDKRNIKNIPVKKFTRLVTGDTILDLSRRAKYLIFKMKSGRCLVIHLGMAGRVLVRPDKYVKVIFHLSGKKIMYFSDTRLFGKIWLYDELPDFQLGPEPLDRSFTLKKFKAMVSKKIGNVKTVIMDQKFLAGLGNIYAAEALFSARIHPKRRIESLSDQENKRLHRSIIEALKAGVEHRGTSVTDYVDAIGKKGSHQNYLKVYSRKGKPCKRCRTPIHKISLGQRGTYFCPSCQK
ncbi:DNA-formamidopyrimidine glycosylase [Candidatus Margulisiibacteriota bacterium]